MIWYKRDYWRRRRYIDVIVGIWLQSWMIVPMDSCLFLSFCCLCKWYCIFMIDLLINGIWLLFVIIMMNCLIIWIMWYRMIVYVYWIVYKNGLLNWFGVCWCMTMLTVWICLLKNGVFMNIHVEEWSITGIVWGRPLVDK